jgi:MarR-like DNA-binding transcriptional regulator SgrR of sgrS sRNA
MDQIEREYEENVEQPVPMEQSDETTGEQVATEDRQPTPGDVLRTLPTEAQQRGTRFISAQAMQAKLFSVYDAAAAAEDALALVQQQLTLTLNRSYYDADEIEKMASQLDSLLALESIDLELEQLDHDDLVSEG